MLVEGGFTRLLPKLAERHAQVRPGRAGRGLGPELKKLKAELASIYERIERHAEKGLAGTRPEEWLLDNRHVVEETLDGVAQNLPADFLRRLPRVPGGEPAPGLVIRVQELAGVLIGAGAMPLDLDWVEQSVQSYQEHVVLQIGELWALPSLIGLAMLEKLVADAGAAADAPGVGADGEDPAEQQSAEIAGAVVSLRLLAECRWRHIFERLCRVERILREDPEGAYGHMEFDSRNRYRNVIEELARGCKSSEVEVAERILSRCRDPDPSDPRTAHVGFYVQSGGRRRLERELGFSPSPGRRVFRAIDAHPGLFYFSLLFILALVPLGGLGIWLRAYEFPAALTGVILILTAVPMFGMAVSLLNGMVTWLIPPRVLAKMNFTGGIPPEFRSAVTVPVLLGSPDEVGQVLDRLEINYLNNTDRQLVYVILGDLRDAPEKSVGADEQILQHATTGIRRLNRQYGEDPESGPFLFMCRDREWNPSEGCWMGWERKRGKLMEFNRMLAGDSDTGYSTIAGDIGKLEGVRFVITLDADTRMPPGSAARLVGTLAHPLSRAILDYRRGGLKAGYSILQPRLQIDPETTSLTRFTQVFSGDVTIDLYTRAVSDVYHDLFGEGIYAGKGIYDWRAFEHILAGRIPENTLLSHDLLEGIHGRVGLVSDVVLLEQFPPNIPSFMRRMHRWVRGDWQLLRWLWPRVRQNNGDQNNGDQNNGELTRNVLHPIHAWQIIDNLRRSLQPPVVLILLGLAWSGVLPGAEWAWTLAIASLMAAPLIGEIFDIAGRGLARPGTLVERLRQAPPALAERLSHWLVSLVLLPYQSFLLIDAISRTLFRLAISRRHLLEWTAAAHVNQGLGGSGVGSRWREMWLSPFLAAVTGGGIAVLNPVALGAALPFIVAWLAAPRIGWWLDRPVVRPPPPLAPADQRYLRQIARRTWMFFDHFVGPDDHWLPPDNYQEQPVLKLARRTSPTNLGMALCSALAAYDFGYLDPASLAAWLRNTMERMVGLDRYRGHWLNWYETRDLRALEPRYVSTVDSGNLAVSLLTIARGLEEIPGSRIDPQGLVRGIGDTLEVIECSLREHSGLEPERFANSGHPTESGIESVVRMLREQAAAADCIEQSADCPAYLDRLHDKHIPDLTQRLLEIIEDDRIPVGAEVLAELRTLIEDLQHQVARARRYLTTFQPWLTCIDELPGLFVTGPDHPQITRTVESIRAGFDGPLALAELPVRYRLAIERIRLLEDVVEKDAPDRSDAVGNWSRGLTGQLESAIAAAETLMREFTELAGLADDWVEEMDFSFLYNPDRDLFHIGYNASVGSLDPNYYDLLASEVRLTSLLCIARGEVPVRHWMHLGRPFRRDGRRRILMSWGATLFEYLMPGLFCKTPAAGLLGRACRTAIDIHRKFSGNEKLPWGISESGYYQFDEQHNYQYRAFGAPGLGFRRDLGDRMVIAPYASALALPYDAPAVVENFRALESHRGLGTFGFYEAVDFGRTGKTGPRRARVVRSYMSHHQGMILLAINNYLNDDVMQRRFHSDPRIAGVAMLLHEQAPRNPPKLKISGASRPGTSFSAVPVPVSWRAASIEPGAAIPYTLLSNGHYSLHVNARGGGGSEWQGIALTRWEPDTGRNQQGMWTYIKDQDRDALFCIGLDPVDSDQRECQAEFGPHRAEFRCRQEQLQCRMSIALSSQHDVEVRKLTINNETGRPRRLVISSFAELVLAARAEFLRHPAFARLFVESECLEDESILIFKRRSRSSAEKPLFLAHTVLVAPGVNYRFAWDTERGRFLGRGGRASRPAALNGGLDGFSGSTGTILDPAFATGIELTIDAYARVEIAWLTKAGRVRAEVLAGLRACRSMPQVEWIFQQASMQSAQELHNIGIKPAEVEPMMSLYSGVLAARREWRRADAGSAPHKHDQRLPPLQSILWSRGISGDWPILLVLVRDAQDLGRIEPLLKAHTLWSGRQARIDLVLIDEASAGYAQQARDRLHDLIGEVRSRTQRRLSGSVMVVPGRELSAQQRHALLAAARLVLDTRKGSLLAQLEPEPRERLPFFVPMRSPEWQDLPTPDLEPPRELQMQHELGGFSADGREYVLHLPPGRLPPAPWSNVLANPEFGCLVTESGSSCTWAGNSSEARLTPWPNDPVCDPSGEVLYLRDEETGAVWTPTPKPMPAAGSHRVAHGAGYTRFLHQSHGLRQEYCIHVDPDQPVKVCRLTLTNTRSWARRVTATYYAEWVLGNTRNGNAPHIVSEYHAATGALLARNRFSRLSGAAVAFLVPSRRSHSFTANRSEFLGQSGSIHQPAALGRIGLSGNVRMGDDPCAASQVHIDIPPGATRTVHFAIGQGRHRAEALDLAGRFRKQAEAERSLERCNRRWKHLLGQVRVETPEPAMDLLLNHWLPYQTLASRVWGRTGYYQSSGAYGFRDQLQDCMALVWSAPGLTRAQILRAAARQFGQGDVLHWWHERPLRGVRTRCSDDMLWLPLVTAHYLQTTGDISILSETIAYLDGVGLEPDESERYAEYSPGTRSGSLYQHCCRAIERAVNVGPHGLPTIGSGDWNDGFNRISTTGRGESVWLAWFLVRVCRDFAPWCEHQGDRSSAEHYRHLADELLEQIEQVAWDGAWYHRAYYDDGTPLGSQVNKECRIDLIAQAWSVLAQDRPGERSHTAMRSVHEHLVKPDARLVLLLAPPFDIGKRDPGYIKGYPPGIRENGAQYTHAATWAVWADAALGKGDDAMELFRLLNPILRTTGGEQIEQYRVEPYVLAGDIYSVEPNAGRGGWSWYTGAAGWLWRAGIEALLGLRLCANERGNEGGEELEIAPCLPTEWTGYRAEIKRGKASYRIEVKKPRGVQRGRVAITFDGELLEGARIPLCDDGVAHDVQVRLDPED